MGKKRKLIKSLSKEIELLRESNENRLNMLISANKRVKELEVESRETRQEMANQIALWEKDLNPLLKRLNEELNKGATLTISISNLSQSSEETQSPGKELPELKDLIKDKP